MLKSSKLLRLDPETSFFGCLHYFSSSWSLGSVLESLVLKNHEECTSQHVKRTSGARVVFLCLANLSYFWSTSDELERSLTDVCRTWAIFDRRLSDLSYLWPTSVGIELFLTDVCRTWAIFDRRVTNLNYLLPTSDELRQFLTDVWRTWAIFHWGTLKDMRGTAKMWAGGTGAPG